MKFCLSPNPRDIAYQSLCLFATDDRFIHDTLTQWRQQCSPSAADERLCQEIAYGTMRMQLALDYLAKQLTAPNILKIKAKERILLRMALYQYLYMKNIPLYAIVNESVNLAKKYCHSSFVGFLNALLRKIETISWNLPCTQDAANISIAHSYPVAFVEMLLSDYSFLDVMQVIKAGNIPGKLFVKKRPHMNEEMLSSAQWIPNLPFQIGEISSQDIAKATTSPSYYIQNVTPALLVHKMASHTPPPKRILDLCAAPGGKLVAAHDAFPQALLYANDVSEQKLALLRNNIEKYQLDVTLTCSLGEYLSSATLFDLVIIDAPCSNSGVLNKRPEARWRISEHTIHTLIKTQKNLLRNGVRLLTKEGCLWYMTCSILKEENEKLIEWACTELGLQVATQESILPTASGWDGGFACCLKFN